MEAEIRLNNHIVNVMITDSALVQIGQRLKTLTVEMELYFSCLIRKKVRFYEDHSTSNSITVMDNLAVRFRPVMTAVCGKDYEGDEPPLTDFPIAKPESFIPRWLKIDYHHGAWHGEFGY